MHPYSLSSGPGRWGLHLSESTLTQGSLALAMPYGDFEMLLFKVTNSSYWTFSIRVLADPNSQRSPYPKWHPICVQLCHATANERDLWVPSQEGVRAVTEERHLTTSQFPSGPFRGPKCPGEFHHSINSRPQSFCPGLHGLHGSRRYGSPRPSSHILLFFRALQLPFSDFCLLTRVNTEMTDVREVRERGGWLCPNPMLQEIFAFNKSNPPPPS